MTEISPGHQAKRHSGGTRAGADTSRLIRAINDNLNEHIRDTGKRFDTVETRLESVETKLDGIETKLDALIAAMYDQGVLTYELQEA